MLLTLKKGAGIQLSRHFNSSEWDCQCSRPECQETKIAIQTLVLAEQTRACLNVGIRITSGYRCAAHNAEVGGANESQHVEGLAIDIQPERGTWGPTDAAKIRELMKDYGGLGQYYRPGGIVAWFHVDSRPEIANWTIQV